MTDKQKAYLFAFVVLTTAVLLWGPKGIVSLLPGPDPK